MGAYASTNILRDELHNYYQLKLACITPERDFKQVIFSNLLYITLHADKVLMFFTQPEHFRSEGAGAVRQHADRVTRFREMIEREWIDDAVVEHKYALLTRNELANDARGILYHPQGMQYVFSAYDARDNRSVRVAFINLGLTYFYLVTYAYPVLAMLIHDVERPFDLGHMQAINKVMFDEFRPIFLRAFCAFARDIDFAADIARYGNGGSVRH